MNLKKTTIQNFFTLATLAAGLLVEDRLEAGPDTDVPPSIFWTLRGGFWTEERFDTSNFPDTIPLAVVLAGTETIRDAVERTLDCEGPNADTDVAAVEVRPGSLVDWIESRLTTWSSRSALFSTKLSSNNRKASGSSSSYKFYREEGNVSNIFFSWEGRYVIKKIPVICRNASRRKTWEASWSRTPYQSDQVLCNDVLPTLPKMRAKKPQTWQVQFHHFAFDALKKEKKNTFWLMLLTFDCQCIVQYLNLILSYPLEGHFAVTMYSRVNRALINPLAKPFFMVEATV